MSWAPAILAALGGLGSIFGSKTKQTENTTSNTQTGGVQNVQGLNVNTPQLNPVASTGIEHLAGIYNDLLSKDPDLSGYQAQQTGNINNLAKTYTQNATENLASRGITGPAVGTAVNNIEGQRFGAVTGLQQQIPLLARQLMETTAGNAAGFFRGIPVGGTTETSGVTGTQGYSSQQGTGQQIASQNPLAGLFGGAGNILALLYGMGAFGQGKNNTESFGF